MFKERILNFGFCKANLNWFDISDCEEDVIRQERQVLEEEYLQAWAELQRRKRSLQQESQRETPQSNVLRVQLADLIPEKPLNFNGNFADWANFKDAFMADVHQNPNLTDVQRLRKLQSSVTGAAAQLLGHWSLVASNYGPAWRTLQEAYDNEYESVRAHLRRLWTLDHMQRPSAEELRRILDTVNDVERQLTLLVPAPELGQLLLMHMIENLLDSRTLEAWELARSSRGLLQLDNLRSFLERRVTAFRNFSNTDTKRARLEINPRTSNQGRSNPSRPPRTTPCRLCTADRTMRCSVVPIF